MNVNEKEKSWFLDVKSNIENIREKLIRIEGNDAIKDSILEYLKELEFPPVENIANIEYRDGKIIKNSNVWIDQVPGE